MYVQYVVFLPQQVMIKLLPNTDNIWYENVETVKVLILGIIVLFS